MIKKFWSFVALSVTLISPIFADEFVPLQYYEEEPVHYIPQTRMVIPNGVMSIDKNFEIGKLYDNNNKKNDKKTNVKVDWNSKKEENKDIDWCGIRDDLVRDNTRSLEEVINNHYFSDTFKSGALEDILWEMRIGNTSHAFEIFDENFHYCASLLSDEPYTPEYTAGPGAFRGGGFKLFPKKTTRPTNNTNNKQSGISVKNNYTNNPKKKVNSTKQGDVVRTPNSYPQDFDILKQRNGTFYKNKYTGEIWQESRTTHTGKQGEWKVGIGKKEPTPTRKITVDKQTGKVLKHD